MLNGAGHSRQRQRPALTASEGNSEPGGHESALAAARGREEATRQILQLISSHRDDEAPVFATMLEHAARLCRASHALLLMRNEADTHLELVASNSAKSGFVDSLKLNPHALDNKRSAAVLALDTMTAQHVADLRELFKGDDRAPQLSVAADVEGMRTVLLVPLIIGGRAEGILSVYRLEVAPFSEREVALVETFAEQAVIAIENVRQFREIRVRLEREEATRSVLEVISTSRDDDQPVFSTITEAVARLCNAPLVYICVLNEAGTHVTIPARIGARPAFAERLARFREPLDNDQLLVVRSTRYRKVIRIDDLVDDDLYRAGNEFRVSMVEEEGMRSVLAVPLVSGDRGVGCIMLYRREVAPFSDDEVTLVEGFAAQAAIAIENVRQFRALEDRTTEVETLNANLETRVAEQVDELERMGRLRRFLSPQVADAVVSSGDEKMLGSHRALIATVFCDIRGFTAFCEKAEPEEAIEILQTYHEELGRLIQTAGAGFDHRAGDGVMVVFNDPIPCDDPAGDAVRMAMDMRSQMAGLCADWRRLGHHLGFGVGISLGYATVGMVGFEGRYDYTASGTAVNLAARLCDMAEDREILLSARAAAAVDGAAELETAGTHNLKGFHAPVDVFRVSGTKDTG